MTQYLDVIAGLVEPNGYKTPVKCAATGPLDNLMTGLPIIDGFQLFPFDRVLVWQNTNAPDNGIYVTGTGGAWSRAIDFSTSSAIRSGTQVIVASGNTYQETVFVCTTEQPIIGTSPISIIPFPTGAMTDLNAYFAALPTTDPLIPGRPWSNGGVVVLSNGP